MERKEMNQALNDIPSFLIKPALKTTQSLNICVGKPLTAPLTAYTELGFLLLAN